MKRFRPLLVPVSAGLIVLVAEAGRLLAVKTGLVAALLTAQFTASLWEILAVALFLLTRLVALWLVPPVLVVWVVVKLWPWRDHN